MVRKLLFCFLFAHGLSVQAAAPAAVPTELQNIRVEVTGTQVTESCQERLRRLCCVGGICAAAAVVLLCSSYGLTYLLEQ